MSANLCALCKRHPAIYIRRQKRPGRRPVTIVSADAQHDLCPACQRNIRNRAQAVALHDAERVDEARP